MGIFENIEKYKKTATALIALTAAAAGAAATYWNELQAILGLGGAQ